MCFGLVLWFISVQRDEFDPDHEILDSEDEVYPSLCFARDCEAAISTNKRNSLFIFGINIPIERKARMKNLRKRRKRTIRL
jgi:hypothetical protein